MAQARPGLWETGIGLLLPSKCTGKYSRDFWRVTTDLLGESLVELTKTRLWICNWAVTKAAALATMTLFLHF